MTNILDFLKKKVNPFQIAVYLATEPSKYMESIEKSVGEFLDKNPKYRDLRNHILDETQWIIIACGVVAVRTLSDVKVSKEVEKQLLVVYARIHEANDRKTFFTSDFLKDLEYKIDSYLVRFNRGLVLRDWGKSSPEILFNEAMKDFTNETMKYITGKSRTKEMTDWEDIYKLQERTEEEDELEQYIFGIIRQFISQFREHFRNFKIET